MFSPGSFTVPVTALAVTVAHTYPDSTDATINKEPTELPKVSFRNTIGQDEEVKTLDSDTDTSNKEAGMINFVIFCEVLIINFNIY